MSNYTQCVICVKLHCVQNCTGVPFAFNMKKSSYLKIFTLTPWLCDWQIWGMGVRTCQRGLVDNACLLWILRMDHGLIIMSACQFFRNCSVTNRCIKKPLRCLNTPFQDRLPACVLDHVMWWVQMTRWGRRQTSTRIVHEVGRRWQRGGQQDAEVSPW